MNSAVEKVLTLLDGFRMCDEMTSSAYSALYDEISLLDDLLKEQEPVLVIQYWDDTYGDYVYACEWCGNHWISIDGSLVNYCPGCGKAVKWDV